MDAFTIGYNLDRVSIYLFYAVGEQNCMDYRNECEEKKRITMNEIFDLNNGMRFIHRVMMLPVVISFYIITGIFMIGFFGLIGQCFYYLKYGEWMFVNAFDVVIFLSNRFHVEVFPWFVSPVDFIGIHNLISGIDLWLYMVVSIGLAIFSRIFFTYVFTILIKMFPSISS